MSHRIKRHCINAVQRHKRGRDRCSGEGSKTASAFDGYKPSVVTSVLNGEVKFVKFE